MPNEGLLGKGETAEGQAKRVEVTLPEGMTVNPSQGEGLVGRSPEDLARERFDSRPGEGCPEASKVGEVKISTPLLKEEARGSVYVASPYDNPFGSLISLYMVAKIPERGILVKQAGVVRPDPKTGQLMTIFNDLPQIPFSRQFESCGRGARSSLVTPPGVREVQRGGELHPVVGSDPDSPSPGRDRVDVEPLPNRTRRRRRRLPRRGTPPFHPGLIAGTINNAAGRYLALQRPPDPQGRRTGVHPLLDQAPPGMTGKLAGIPFCSDAAIAAAKARTGPHGGQEEIDRPAARPPRKSAGPWSAPAWVRSSPTSPARSTWPVPTTARRSRSSRSPPPRPAPSTSAPWSSARR